ncbi:hypothetical protein [Methanosarcina sp.]|jgi:hypothetical protein|uniref:hypothetical protein n=1 Tax=Methanosarcina sp. TaxID=2213 RepID=UPI0029884435|nr:hypothetical protein [Methanosarcina sp.]MDW5551544.1 hypothetical protein [Methanosarcina sp.]MDW5555446.1 hypothetical protein [Methanosarcina sp.]MDW5560082.1 hypothetical protein [Methanosarcina sp.]
MQLIKKPENLVLEAQKGAARQKVEQKDRCTDKLKTYNCFKELKTDNFETLNPEMRFCITYSNSILSDSTCKAERPGLPLLQTAEKDISGFNLQLTGNILQVVTGNATEYCSCPLTRKVEN